MSKKIGNYSEDELRRKAFDCVKDRTNNSKILSVAQEDLVPRFQAAGTRVTY